MKGELLYVYSPWRWRIAWVIIYAILLAGGVFGLYSLSNQFGTHTIPAGNIQLVIPYSKYLLGETVAFTIYNRFNSTIYVTNNCQDEPLEVYRWANGSWQRIHDKSELKDCPKEARQIAVPANGSTSGTFEAWHHLFDQPGKYRVVAYVEYYNALPYQDFEVVAKPEIPKSPVPSTTVTGGATSRPSSPGATQPKTSARQSKTITTSGGSLTVQYDANTIYIISINPAHGFTYERSNNGRQVEVTFKGSSEIQVQLTVNNGQLTVRTESV